MGELMDPDHIFGQCGDCGAKAHTAEQFSDHAHACKKNPIPWKPTPDYLARRRERDNPSGAMVGKR